jgi:diguanylate cyclase
MTDPQHPQPYPTSVEQVHEFLLRQRSLRLRQILRVSQAAILAVCVISLGVSRYGDALVLFGTGMFLFTVDWAITRKNILLGSWLLLTSITVMLIYLAWVSNGVRGAAPLGFSGILLFAAVLGDRRLLYILMSVMAFTCLLIGHANQTGWHVNEIAPTTMLTGLITVIVLATIGYGASLLARDYQVAIQQVASEHELVANAKSHIERMALHDPLTGLPNRIMAHQNFSHLFWSSKKKQQLLGIIFIDLDNLKPINDSLGHQAGDQILKEVAQRLVEYTKQEGLACRYGGDEFIVFLPNIQSAEDASQASLDILQLISKNYVYRNIEIFCTCSIGIAMAPQDGEDLDTLIKKADIAMYHSKDSGRNSFRFFNASISHNMLEHISLISAMRKALHDNQFSLHYQPKIDLQDNSLSGFEALLRWNHPEQGFIPPATFIPLAESSGLIIQLGEWVINEACRQAKIWRDAGMQDFSIAVNISSIQFKRGNIDTLVFNALNQCSLPPQYLELELTESLLIEDSERLANTLSNLRSEGVHFSIDDFGTGYSNLGYLKKFEVESLKIDQSFVRKMDDHTGDAAIVRAIIQMAISLGLKTIAEGVEDATTAALLRGLGCNKAQGYYWARPMPAEEAKTFWDNWKRNKE